MIESRRDFLKAGGIILGSSLLAGCAPAVTEKLATLTPYPELTPSPAVTVLPFEGAKVVPTAIRKARVEEHDLAPKYTESVDKEYVGVRIKAELITDESISSFKKAFVPQGAYAEFIARTIFNVWRAKGDEKPTGAPTEGDFKAFMVLWSQAQKTNDPADWKKVKINDIWANDLNDGNGYKQQSYTIWPMFSGEAPEGVMGIDNFAIALVRPKSVSNITMFDNNNYDEGMGTNVDGGTIYIYVGIGNFMSALTPGVRLTAIAGEISNTDWWIIKNYGGKISGYSYSATHNLPPLAKKLWSSGFQLSP